MVTAFVRIRTLVLALTILAAGFAAIAPQAPQEATAAGPCSLKGLLGIPWGSGGTVLAVGVSECSSSNFQKVTTILKMNGAEIGRTTRHGWSWYMSSTVYGPTCRPGALYQTVVVHQYGDGLSSPARTDYTSSGAPSRLC